jgi:hypothetical protein
MYVIDASGLQYLTRENYQDIYHDLDAYNRQANWVNSGAKQLTVNEVPAILGMLANLDAMVASVGEDGNAPMEVREEAGGLLAGIKYATDNLNAPVAPMAYAQNPNATYTEEQYFQ